MRKILNTFIVITLLVTLSLFSIGCDDDDDGDDGTQPTPTPTTSPSPTPTVSPSPTPTVSPSPTPTVSPSPTPTVSPSPTPPPEAGLDAAPVDTDPVGCEDPVWQNAAEVSVDAQNVITGNLYGDGQLNMTGTLNGTDTFNRGEDPNLRLTALYTTDQIFIRLRWNDQTLNIDRRRALYNGPADPNDEEDTSAETQGFTSQLNDDKFGLAFEIEPASSEFGTFNEVGCAAACHNVAGEGLDMRPAEGKVDIWHWKTSRSEPLGFVNDQFTDPNGRISDTTGTAIENRNLVDSTNNRSGPRFIWNGTTQTIPAGSPREGEALDPAFTLFDSSTLLDVSDRDADNGETIYQSGCQGCHGVNGEGVGAFPPLNTIDFGRRTDDQLHAIISAPTHPGAGAYNALPTDADRADLRLRVFGFWGIPGYFLTIPTEGNADITTITDLDYSIAGIDSLDPITTAQPPPPDPADALNKYKFQQTEYCVVAIRNLVTTDPDDVQFDDTAQEYVFGVALMDNDGINHIGNTRLILRFLP